MRTLFLALLVTLSFGANAELVSDIVFGDTEQIDLAEKVKTMYEGQIEIPSSNLYLALSGYAAQQNLSFMTNHYEEDTDGQMSVNLETIIVSGSGKSGCCFYGSQRLIPIWASYKGTGLIEEIVGFLEVSVSVELGEDLEKTTYAITRIVPFNLHQ